MIHIYVGYDPREAVAYHTFCNSVIQRCSKPRELTFTPVTGAQHDGSNQFIYARFEPFINSSLPRAMFFDGDMTCLGDVAELWELFDPRYAVQVVKHDYATRFRKKYWGQVNPDYKRKNWSSVMLMNLVHPVHGKHSREIYDAIHRGLGSYLHRFAWIPDELIGELPRTWNWLAKEYPYNPDVKLVHHTIGLPIDPIADDDPWRFAWNENYLATMRYRP